MILSPDHNLDVKFEVYDKDFESDDFLGRLVPLQLSTFIIHFIYIMVVFVF